MLALNLNDFILFLLKNNQVSGTLAVQFLSKLSSTHKEVFVEWGHHTKYEKLACRIFIPADRLRHNPEKYDDERRLPACPRDCPRTDK